MSDHILIITEMVAIGGDIGLHHFYATGTTQSGWSLQGHMTRKAHNRLIAKGFILVNELDNDGAVFYSYKNTKFPKADITLVKRNG